MQQDIKTEAQASMPALLHWSYHSEVVRGIAFDAYSAMPNRSFGTMGVYTKETIGRQPARINTVQVDRTSDRVVERNRIGTTLTKRASRNEESKL